MADSIWFRLRRVRPADLIHVFKFISAWPFAQIYKRFRGHLWLLCEYGTEARDNAYYLFAYLRCVLLGKRWNTAAGGTGFTT